MINKIMKRFALSREGAKGLVQAIIACTFADIVLMFPVGLLYFLVNDFIEGKIPENHHILYGIGIIAALLLIFFRNFGNIILLIFQPTKSRENAEYGLRKNSENYHYHSLVKRISQT